MRPTTEQLQEDSVKLATVAMELFRDKKIPVHKPTPDDFHVTGFSGSTIYIGEDIKCWKCLSVQYYQLFMHIFGNNMYLTM